MLLPSLSMVFDGSGPLVKRCDGFDGSLWSTEQQCHPDSSGYFFSIWRDRLFSWALANPNNNWWWNEKAYSMRSLRFGWIKFDKAPWLQMLQCQGVMWQTSCLELLEREGLGRSKQRGGKGEWRGAGACLRSLWRNTPERRSCFSIHTEARNLVGICIGCFQQILWQEDCAFLFMIDVYLTQFWCYRNRSIFSFHVSMIES